jgi:hypothetical protein
MNTKSNSKVIKTTNNKKITKQDELDELDELSNILEERTRVLEKITNESIILNNRNKDKVKDKVEDKVEDKVKDNIQSNSTILININKPISNDGIKFGKKQYQLIEETSDLYENLENELLPKNFGNKWSDEDKQNLMSLLKQSMSKEIDYTNIALKLGRSEGGVKGEIKKMIISRYFNGEEANLIAIDMNIQYKFIKILIKSYIENEIDTDIINLEKENKLLKLKMENMELRKNIYKLTN